MSETDRYRKQRIAADLQEPVEKARELAVRLGLDPYPVNYWVVDYDEMNELIAYDGFQERYPHWRWGMKYDRQQKQGQYSGGKAFEIVNNDNPSNAFLQESNTLADQKAVITHVEAHSDFFANNEWFGMFVRGEDREDGRNGPGRDPTEDVGVAEARDSDTGRGPNAAAMLARHARAIREYMHDPDIDRGEVERWIDHLLSLEDTIDQHDPFSFDAPAASTLDVDPEDIDEKLAELNLSDEVREEVFDQEWLDGQREDVPVSFPAEPVKDVLGFLRHYGKQYDREAEKATEMEPWQKDVLDMLRAEAHYFAAQKMTKVMNEGWAAYWESMMMGEEAFAGTDEFLSYADHQARVLGSPGLNPYKLGKELWEYVENTTNRREVVERLLRVEGVSWRNFDDVVDEATVLAALEPPATLDSISSDTLDDVAALPDEYVDREALARARDGDLDVDSYPWAVLTYEGLSRRHYSLVKPQYRGFFGRVSQSELERVGRYLFDDDRYASVEEALADVDFSAGWDRMRELRKSHNDVTFLDAFLTQEFVDDNEYFTYEYAQSTGQFQVSSTDHEDVKKKLLLQFTNFGKPTIRVHDGNYENRNELLLGHHYNGIMLDVEQAKRTLERVFELWGRPVNLKTIVKELDEHDLEVAKRRNREPEPSEQGKLLRYDGEEFSVIDLPWEDVEDIAADDIDYDTKPDDWLA